MTQTNKKGCEQTHKIINKSQLPLSCPNSTERVWDGHPKIYMPIEKTGHAKCTYCGTEYKLED